MKVRNMQSERSGRDIANQFIITDGDKEYFQSYTTTIAVIENGQVTLDEDKWEHSTTTGKYRNIFLGEKVAETRKKIASGEYKLSKLNLQGWE